MFAKTVTDMVDYIFGVGVSGRRPSSPPTPRSGVRVSVERELEGGKVIVGLGLEFWGQGAGVQKVGVPSPAVSRGACNPLQPARTSALPEGAGGAVPGARVTIGRATEIWVSQEAISGPISKSLSTIFKPTVQQRWSTFHTTVLFFPKDFSL